MSTGRLQCTTTIDFWISANVSAAVCLFSVALVKPRKSNITVWYLYEEEKEAVGSRYRWSFRLHFSEMGAGAQSVIVEPVAWVIGGEFKDFSLWNYVKNVGILILLHNDGAFKQNTKVYRLEQGATWFSEALTFPRRVKYRPVAAYNTKNQGHFSMPVVDINYGYNSGVGGRKNHQPSGPRGRGRMTWNIL
ncbi:uncharacterized protein EV420DRAFT_1754287 [Desarmillaria tabescens]|uniref:Uncharacterized protein n=1 Tax=Armillaria tabescens TaxID=1929756 RepID=A0AA39J2F3_ARMTA|nr:uncharacterized protein EV420DRAFT_1754287 [Desarmillaria tabescens]KAK0434858.1 hypothetical protein EV420DRAFT_1754287 [Desarmillaria tabescens]